MTEAQEQTRDSMSVSAPEGEAGAGKKTLGLERWVQLGYFITAIALIWLYQNAIAAVWYRFADPDETIVMAASMVLGAATTIGLYKHARFNLLSFEVAEELSRVTWPTRRETSSSTVVVIITSIIAAAVLGFFDTIWSALTDLVYKV